jgi:hypothetical protein
MPYLHLPSDHSDADMVLAAQIAEVVGSDDLYVAWTHDGGPGAVPEVQALVRDARPSPLADLISGVVSGVLAFWHSLTHPAPAPPTPAPSTARAAAPARDTSP